MKKQYNKSNVSSNSEIEQINAQYGKLPPQAIEVEMAVLGALMLETEAIHKVIPILPLDSFYKNEHRKIFKVLMKMASNNQNIDLLQVTQTLKDNKLLDEVGGPGYITQLTRKVASAAHIEFHAVILRQKFVQRQVIRVANEMQAEAYNDDFDTLSMLWTSTSQDIDDLMTGKSGIKHIAAILEDTELDLKERERKAKEGITPGVTTGLYELDKINSGWQNGDLIIVAARPSMGKTAISINLFAKAAAQSQKSVCIFSLEMEKLKLSKRLILSYGGIVRDRFEKGTMESGDWEAFNKARKELSQLPIYIDDTAGTTIQHIGSVCRNKKRTGECDLIVIDYLQLITSSDANTNRNREREVAIISAGLKQVARDVGVPVILLAQLNRALENRPDKTPRLADLRESGAIEQDADIVLFPWRPSYYDIEQDADGVSLVGTMLLEIAKNRDGRLDTLPIHHNHDLTVFSDVSVKQFIEPTPAPY